MGKILLYPVTGITLYGCSCCSLPFTSSHGTPLQIEGFNCMQLSCRELLLNRYQVRSLRSCRSRHGSYPPMEKPQCGTTLPSSSLLSHGDQDQHKAFRLSPLSPRTSPKFTSLERDFWRGPYVFQHLAAETTGLQSLTVPTDTLMGLKQM